ncbi:MAG: hypothetical protein NUW37_15195 [Planctomycetes bacterium]|nr:hypothetical protein [Planctomycetota bacterium]
MKKKALIFGLSFAVLVFGTGQIASAQTPLPRGGVRMNLPGGGMGVDVLLSNATGSDITDVTATIDYDPQVVPPQQVVNITNGFFQDADGDGLTSSAVGATAPSVQVVLANNIKIENGKTFHLVLDFDIMVPAGDYTLELSATINRRILLSAINLTDSNQVNYELSIPSGGFSLETLFVNQTDRIVEAVTLFVPGGAILDPGSVYGGPFPIAETSWGSVRFSGAQILPGQSFGFGAIWDQGSPDFPNNDKANARLEYATPTPIPPPDQDVIGLIILGVVIFTLVGLLIAAILALAGRTRAALVAVVATLVISIIVLGTIFLLSYLELVELKF